ncbi:ATP-dependent Clp protease ATP-binding subunit [Apilactobacillus kunkeei]|uniref:ATP-binding protein n=1 Tax=Apilactobacillus kunkeei DSM 12361 = ATCC 700308 TaxID=1423768 RepID=A0A0R1FTC0_9LACO|nr:ATP-dependent Clp protease ATP-binding subunit [Apilactobacillus kunkeei]KOY72656.1 ATP-binding subunit of Clp protease and DnaK/DnaJ chaperones [Apilactobacillus kunkeei DSM 12361 = ATCC 700308]KPN82371.1 ATP-binding subunit of Clp protease and DnaK/DnaJ chaperones [Apilactobacillus kunkeei]KRK22404.1 ATP-binding protein [Apilactobacillus kunkeei DSM 12361 = ATCC 700308]MCK8625306.1 ATP-dependent Clp protease ATP-binding subunit [Apilactobacillus kunkeei]MCK8635559.1 ATP-dependent Clp prot
MDNIFTPSAKNVLILAQEQAKVFGHQGIGTEHLLLALSMEDNGIAKSALKQCDVHEDDIKGEMEILVGYGNLTDSDKDTYLPYSPKAEAILTLSGQIAKKYGAIKIGTEHLLLAILDTPDTLAARILVALNVVEVNDVKKVLLRKMGFPGDSSSNSKNIPLPGSRAARNNGTTPTLDSLATDLTKSAKDGLIDPTIGRDDVIKRVIQILSRRTKNNPVLIGEAGVGKTAVVEGLALKVAHRQVPEDMQNKRIMMLEMGTLVAGTKYRGEFEKRLMKIISEIKSVGNVILFIDELHTLMGAGGAEGAIDASNILKPALARGDLQTIGATTLDEYQKYIEKDGALARRFATVSVDEPTRDEAVEILKGIRPKYESHHQVKITDDAIEKAVDLSSRYISNRFLPDKAIDLMDEAAAMVRINNLDENNPLEELENKINEYSAQMESAIEEQRFEDAVSLRQKEQELQEELKTKRQETADIRKQRQEDHNFDIEETGEDVAKVVSEWTGVPVTKMTKADSKRLVNLESILHKKIIGQNEAVSAVSRAIRRARSGIKDPNRPIGSFIFLGPTGVGKTELAKDLAEEMFGSKDDIIRIDMSEYMQKESASRMVGSAPGYVGYDEGGQLTEKVRQHPYSVVLFDEVEKAHPDVFNLLLQVLDDGYLTDSKGRHVDFRNTVLIMTSNLGARTLRDKKTVGFGAELDHDDENYKLMRKTVEEQMKRFFRPEFLNRIDETIIFHELNEKQVQEIVKLMSNDLLKRVHDLGINVKMTPAAIELIAKNGFNPEYGARPIRRALQNDVEDKVSEEILSGEIKPGDDVSIGASKGKITITKKEAVKA